MKEVIPSFIVFMEPIEELPEILTVENLPKENIKALDSEIAGAKTDVSHKIKAGARASEYIHPVLSEVVSRISRRNNDEVLLPWLNSNDFMGDEPSRKVALDSPLQSHFNPAGKEIFRLTWHNDGNGGKTVFSPVKPWISDVLEQELLLPMRERNGQKQFLSKTGYTTGEMFRAKVDYQGRMEVIAGTNGRFYVPVTDVYARTGKRHKETARRQ